MRLMTEKPSPGFGKFGNGRAPMMAMVEVTNRCDMDCPVCFSDANHPAEDVAFEEIRGRLERLLAVTGAPIPVQLSGGEPTVRRDFGEVVGLARELGYRNVEVITNGLRVAREPELLAEWKRRGLTAVYLQFDGLRRETYLRIRGRDMTEVRSAAVEAARRAGLCVTLAVAVTRGVNDDELGDVVRYALANLDTVRAVNFQSATRFTGRFDLPPENRGFSLPEILRLIELQTGIPADAFRGDPNGHPLCNAMSLVFVVDGRLEPLFRYVSEDDFREFLGEDAREKLLGLFRGKAEFVRRYGLNPCVWRLAAKAAPIFARSPWKALSTKHLLVFAKSFMERDAVDPHRIARCGYGISAADGVHSFCAFNNWRRFPERVAARGSS